MRSESPYADDVLREHMEQERADGAEQASVAVLVLGDIGRSPRMQYHTYSFAEKGVHVDFVGYEGEPARDEVEHHPNITQHRIWQFPWRFPRPLFVVYAFFKLLVLTLQLFWVLLFGIRKPSLILMQNPPAIPSMVIVYIVCKIRGAKLVIDWHNFGYSILAINLGQGSPLVKIHRWYEHFFGRRGDAHLCVSAAMQSELEHNWGISAHVLYDRPPAFFKRLSVAEAHELLASRDLKKSFKPCAEKLNRKLSSTDTLFTHKQEKGKEKEGQPITFTKYYWREDRPALIVSSTSWTPDEDFSILLAAIDEYERIIEERKDHSFPHIIFVITGKGPQKEYYLDLIKQKSWNHTQVITMWLTAENYPKFLGVCDLGISLHTSSSGMDLPMKVVDMFGCSMPVCAYKFACVDELVKHQENGLLFDSSKQLGQQIYQLFRQFPNKDELARVTAEEPERWDDSWEGAWQAVFAPLILGTTDGEGLDDDQAEHEDDDQH